MRMRCLLLLSGLTACSGKSVDTPDGTVDSAVVECPPFALTNTTTLVDAELLGQPPPDVQGGNAGIGHVDAAERTQGRD